MNPDDVRRARIWADVYKSLGYQPLPSRTDAKRPMCRFADLWEKEAPDDLFTRFETTNIQIMTGRYWSLAVLDLDGPEAIEHVKKKWRPLPPTWVSSTGGGGEHWWFRLPDGIPFEKGKTVLWKGEGDHSGIELLADRCLVIAPPSIHPKTGSRYTFIDFRLSPSYMRTPARLPWRLWTTRGIEPPLQADPRPSLPPRQDDRDNVDRRLVLDSIGDKIAVARSWGLRFASRPNQSNGWVSVHDFNRVDEHPSARFHRFTGQFWRPGEIPMSLFDLGVALGVYRDWIEARDDLASRYLAVV